MDCFERKTYETLFRKEEIEIIRWDKIDGDVLVRMFRQEQIRMAAESLVAYIEQFSGTGDMRKKLSRYLYPSGNFDDMMLFLRYAVGIENYDYEKVLEQLELNFAQANVYGEPSWVLWGRFLTDVLDVLRQWVRCEDNVMRRINYF